jgi:Protein of unknown function (DUF3426)
MATNPRIPDNRDRERGPVLAPKLTVDKRSPLLPWLALLAGIAILAVIIYSLPRTPKQMAPATGGVIPNQDTGAQIQLSQLKLSPMGPDNSINLDGMVFNNGNQPVLSITTEATFRDNNGQVIGRVPAAMLSVEQNGGPTSTFADSPLKPQAMHPFRLQFHNLPQNWNHQVPELRITDVSSTTKK